MSWWVGNTNGQLWQVKSAGYGLTRNTLAANPPRGQTLQEEIILDAMDFIRFGSFLFWNEYPWAALRSRWSPECEASWRDQREPLTEGLQNDENTDPRDFNLRLMVMI